jgi:hypothetical protein
MIIHSKMRTSLPASFFIFLVTLSLAGAAAAQTPIQIEESKKHFTKAVDFFKKENYREALDEFNRSYDLRPHWGILYNIGICYLKLDKKGKALMILMKYAEKGGAEVSKEKSEEVENFIQDLMSQVGIVRFNGDLTGAKVLVDGEQYPEANENLYLYLDPGKRYIRIVRGQAVLYEDKVVVREGDEVVIYLEALGPPSVTSTTEPVVKPGTTEPVVPKPKPEKPKMPGRDLKIVGMTFAGLAGALIVGYAAAGGVALSEKNRMDDVTDEWNNVTSQECIVGPDCDQKLADAQSAQQSHHDKAGDAKTAANVLFGVALACAVVSIGAFIGAVKKGKETNPPDSFTALNPVIGISPGGISLDLSF